MPTRLANAVALLSTGDAVNQSQTGPHRLLGIMFMCLRIAEIREDAVSHILGDIAPKLDDHLSHNGVIGRRAPHASPQDQGERPARLSRPDRKT